MRWVARAAQGSGRAVGKSKAKGGVVAGDRDQAGDVEKMKTRAGKWEDVSRDEGGRGRREGKGKRTREERSCSGSVVDCRAVKRPME